MDSPVTIADREHRLLQLNAELDQRYKDLIQSPSTSTIKHAKCSNNKSEDVQGTRKTSSESDVLLRKPFVYHEQVTNAVPIPKPNVPMQASEVKPRTKANLARIQLDDRRNASTEASIKFLKAKVSILQQELDVSRADQTTQNAVMTKQQEDAKKLVACADRLASQNQALSEQVDKLQRSLSDARDAVKTKTAELNETVRQLEESNSDLANRTHHATNLERRLAKTAEDLAYTREHVQAARAAEQEIASAHKADKRHAETQLKLLADQRAGLIAAYKKQMYLLDNLKRQNVCLEQAKLVEFVERDFVRMLESNTKR